MEKGVIKLLSPAKVNLGLWIRGKRPDGYHEILTIFHAIDLCDEVFLKEGPLRVETSTGIPMQENLVYRALIEFQRITSKEVEFSVFINKKIPEGAGLGGGSSNVAVVLKKVNELLGSPLSLEELSELLGRVSSDAPFFLTGGTAIGEGRGEILTPVKNLNLNLTLVMPQLRCSTKEVYSHVREEHLEPDIDKEYVLSLLEEKRVDVFRNRLGEVACELYSQLGEVVRFLEHLGHKALVSGSGSAVFYIGKPSPELVRGARLRGWEVIEAKSWLGV